MQNLQHAKWRSVPVWILMGMCFLMFSQGWSVSCFAENKNQSPQTGLPQNLTDEEKTRLRHEDNPKDLVETCLKLGGQRLAQARGAVNNQDYNAAEQNLEVYHELMSYAFQHAREAQIKDKKRDQIFRMMETTLRRQLPMLECITRDCPESVQYTQMTLSHVREMRNHLLNAVFGGDFMKTEEITLRVPEQ